MPSRRQVLTGLGAAGAVGLAGCAGLDGGGYSPGSDDTTAWPMPAYDRGFSAYNPDAAAPRHGVIERWSVAIPGPSAPPVVAAGRVLVPTREALVALDLATGEEHWRHGEQQPWVSGTVVHDGTAYVGFADHSDVVAIDVASGAVRWRVETRGAVTAAPTFDLGHDALFVGDDTGRLYQVDPSTGDIVLRGEVFGPVSAIAHGRTLLVGTESGEVTALFPHRGAFTGLWRQKVGSQVTALAARDDAIFVGTFGGPVYRLQGGARVGSNRWADDRGSIHLAATSRDLVGSDGGGLRAFDARSGTVEWRRKGRYDARPAIAGDTVYVGGGEVGEGGHGYVAAYALSGGVGVGPVRLGGKRWQADLESAVMEGVVVADGAVFTATQASRDAPARVFAFEPG